MEILVAIKKALKKAGIPEKYAAKVKALFNVESEENLEKGRKTKRPLTMTTMM